MRVAGEARSGLEVLEKARLLKPDVVIMDLAMPVMNGLKATVRLRAELPAIKVLVLTSYEDQCYFQQMCQADVSGYILKRSAGEELLCAIRKVAAGEFHLDAGLAARTLSRHLSLSRNRDQLMHRKLTGREEEVLRGVAFGYTNKELANRLALSVKTIECYKVRICEKLSLRSRADMVQFALNQGWLEEGRAVPQVSI